MPQRISLLRCLSAAALVSATAAALAQPAPGQGRPPTSGTGADRATAYPVAPAPGLYQALGERAGLQALMTDFVARLRADRRIGHQFKDTNAKELAARLTEQLCLLSGGPCRYEGASMKDAHADLQITRADFNALVEVLQQALDARGVPFTRQNQLLALLAPMHRDIVAPSTAPAP
ncbi:group I truncated hemoglobin [Rubrivivax rivuli]|uniref:Group 1 truncated hemoglobin n=1 Tax=Rubrivivax rivuli TaxID=1862385 RepID=A0A437RFS7_9BURK|nr:group 1 truncated hemoglobin [Rubrivivax rivuli]RVU45599.1 group 1 truncated hemoglobin [Rubrivivax rivuli]